MELTEHDRIFYRRATERITIFSRQGLHIATHVHPANIGLSQYVRRCYFHEDGAQLGRVVIVPSPVLGLMSDTMPGIRRQDDETVVEEGILHVKIERFADCADMFGGQELELRLGEVSFQVQPFVTSRVRPGLVRWAIMFTKVPVDVALSLNPRWVPL